MDVVTYLRLERPETTKKDDNAPYQKNPAHTFHKLFPFQHGLSLSKVVLLHLEVFFAKPLNDLISCRGWWRLEGTRTEQFILSYFILECISFVGKSPRCVAFDEKSSSQAFNFFCGLSGKI
jgi:hypothetical protein